jgi:hypothetical protein
MLLNSNVEAVELRASRCVGYLLYLLVAREDGLQSAPTKGAQLVFCDLSTPHPNGRWFSVYNDVREKLVDRGIPADQIAFAQDATDDASKAMLFKSVREGESPRSSRQHSKDGRRY